MGSGHDRGLSGDRLLLDAPDLSGSSVTIFPRRRSRARHDHFFTIATSPIRASLEPSDGNGPLYGFGANIFPGSAEIPPGAAAPVPDPNTRPWAAFMNLSGGEYRLRTTSTNQSCGVFSVGGNATFGFASSELDVIWAPTLPGHVTSVGAFLQLRRHRRPELLHRQSQR
jgi:hypothetical protein